MISGVESLFGPMLIGVFFNCILYGICVMQIFVYFQAYNSRDKWWIRLFVVYLFFCETVNTACDMAVIYEPLITRNGTVEALTRTPLMIPSDPVITVMISLPVQLFIAWRVKILNRSSILPAIIVIFSIASFLGGIATAVLITILRKYADLPKAEIAATIWLLASTVADILITGALVFSLVRRRTGMAATDHLVNRIIRLTVQTGFVTAAFAVNVVLFMTLRGTWNLIFDFSLSKLYSNSLLSTLNARGAWKVTSSIRDNVLFGSAPGPVSVESVPRSRTQIELVTSHGHRVSRHSRMVPMKPFESGTGYHHEDSTQAINVTPKYADVV